MHSLQMKIFALVLGLLLLIQGASLFILYGKVRAEAERNLNERLQAGSRVLIDQLATRRQSLMIYSTTVAKDFGLLEAFHEGGASLKSALDKRRRQVGADTAVALDRKGIIRADTARPGLVGGRFELANDALPYAATHPLFMDLGGTTYQMTAAPLRAPIRIGWVLLGFKVDDALARQLSAYTSLQTTLLEQRPDGSWTAPASTLPVAARSALAQTSPEAGPLTLDGETYLGLPLEIGTPPGQRMTALLQSSESAALTSYLGWWREIAEVLLGALALALLGAWALARSVVRPVRLLVEQAGAIEAGNYAEPITVRQRGELGELVTKFNRMQQAIAEREASIRRHAEHDPLTGLVNRFHLEQLIQESVVSERDVTGPRLGVMIAGLERFKDINDTLGYDAGDKLLRRVAERLQNSVGPNDVVGRIGGDEFGILLRDSDVRQIQARLETVCGALDYPFQVEGITMHLSAAIGLSIYPDHGRNAATLLRHADLAKGVAKQKHRRYAIFDGTQDRYSLLRLGLLGELQSAIEHGDLVLHYQPKMDLARGEVAGAEALIRWQHPIYGLIPPAEFIPMVEHTGNITLVTAWALRNAYAQAQAWKQAGMDLRLAVNISAHDLRNNEFVDSVEQLLDGKKSAGALLAMEVTESAVMEDVDQALAAFKRFHELGITLSIDDYGTGYSSMAQLKRLPVDELKIDKSFVLGVDSVEDDEIIVRSTIELGHNMGLKVVGEGVESRAGLEALRKLRCDVAQGHFISRSLPVDKFEHWWQSGARRLSIVKH